MRSTERVPARYACYNNLQAVGDVNVQNIFSINSPHPSPLSDIINSESLSSVSLYHKSFKHFHFTLFARAIRIHQLIIPFTPLSSIFESTSMCKHSLSVHNPTFNDSVCACTILTMEWMTHTIQQLRRSMVTNQQSSVFH